MSLILRSKTRKGWLLKIGDPAGVAYLEINGLTHHLGKPYLNIRYIPGGQQTKVFSGYVVEGWFVAGWLDKPITTIKFIQILKSLGFYFANGLMSANAFRFEITKELPLEEREKINTAGEEHRWKKKKTQSYEIGLDGRKVENKSEKVDDGSGSDDGNVA